MTGLRPELPERCREFARQLAAGAPNDAHASECAACARHFAAARVLADALRRRPKPPAELSSARLLEVIYERATQQMERSPLGAALSQAMPVGAEQLPDQAIDAIPPQLLATELAPLLSAAPPMPSAATWSQMRESILATASRAGSLASDAGDGADVGRDTAGASAARPVARVGSRRWLLATVGTVAASVVAGLLMDGKPAEPLITFSDLSSAPVTEFTMLRHGVMR